MDHGKIFKRAWNMLWSYRALWVFGIILALTTSSGGLPPSRGNGGDWSGDWGAAPPITIPEQDLDRLDFDWVEELEAELEEMEAELEELERFGQLFETEMWSKIVRILIWTGIGVFVLILISRVARYVAEAALLGMVNDYGETGKRYSVGKGFRLGWSRNAWRLFLINLLVDLPATIASLGLLALVTIPILTTGGWDAAGPAFGRIMLSAGLFFPALLLIFVAGILLRLLKRLARRACVVEGLGAVDSLGRGFTFAREHIKDVIITWLITLGVRIGWMIILIPACVALLASGAAIVGGVSLLIGGWRTVIVSGILALFIFIIPMAILGGLREVFLSSVWTLSYRELLYQSPEQDEGQGQAVDREAKQLEASEPEAEETQATDADDTADEA
jgi:hypothetical protein